MSALAVCGVRVKRVEHVDDRQSWLLIKTRLLASHAHMHAPHAGEFDDNLKKTGFDPDSEDDQDESRRFRNSEIAEKYSRMAREALEFGDTGLAKVTPCATYPCARTLICVRSHSLCHVGAPRSVAPTTVSCVVGGHGVAVFDTLFPSTLSHSVCDHYVHRTCSESSRSLQGKVMKDRTWRRASSETTQWGNTATPCPPTTQKNTRISLQSMSTKM
jgi:hypothetical protein